MKKIVSILLAAVLAVGLVFLTGCGENGDMTTSMPSGSAVTTESKSSETSRPSESESRESTSGESNESNESKSTSPASSDAQ